MNDELKKYCVWLCTESAVGWQTPRMHASPGKQPKMVWSVPSDRMEGRAQSGSGAPHAQSHPSPLE